jgi:hypothetical protein
MNDRDITEIEALIKKSAETLKAKAENNER